MLELLWLLLPLAAFSGYASAAKRYRPKGLLPEDYFQGLNHLLHERPEKAVLAFGRMLGNSPETVEAAVMLGALFRKRGDLHKAIAIHQSIVEQQGLKPAEREQALFALGVDYLQSGLLDRAEGLFIQIAKQEGLMASRAEWLLLSVYEKEKEWDKAIDIALQIEDDPERLRQVLLAQYFCEKAFLQLQTKDYQSAYLTLQDALCLDKYCVRASLLLGECLVELQDYKGAIKALKRIEKQNIVHMMEALGLLGYCHQQIGAIGSLVRYLESILEKTHHPEVLDICLYYKERHEGIEITGRFLTEYLGHHPSLQGLALDLKYRMRQAEGMIDHSMHDMYMMFEKIIRDGLHYQCGACGYRSKSILWQCPSCQKWATLRFRFAGGLGVV